MIRFVLMMIITNFESCSVYSQWCAIPEVDLSVLSLWSHGGQVGCPKDSVPMVPWRTGGMWCVAGARVLSRNFGWGGV